MGLNEREGAGKIYLSIVGGQISRRYKEHQRVGDKTVTVERDITDDQGEVTKTIIERCYQDIDGIISKAKIDTSGDYGSRLMIELIDGSDLFVLQISLESSYGRAFMLRSPNIDAAKPVIIRPYSFEDEDGKKQTGVVVYQTGCDWEKDKVPYKWTKDEPGEMPEWEFTMVADKKKWNSDKQTNFLAQQFSLWGNAIEEKFPKDLLEDEPSAEQVSTEQEKISDLPESLPAEENVETMIGGEGVNEEAPPLEGAKPPAEVDIPPPTEEDDLPF